MAETSERVRDGRPRRRGGRTLEAVSTAALVAISIIMRPFPGAWTTRLFGAVGRVALPRSRAARRVAENLALTRPQADEREARRLAAAVGDNFGRVVGEYLRFDAFLRRPDRLRIEGAEHLLAAAAKGRGVVVVTAHFGNWEAVRLAARELGVPLGLLRRGFNNVSFDRVSQRLTSRLGEPVLTKTPQAMIRLSRTLRRGGAMLTLLDQRIGRDPALPFLGVDAPTNLSVAGLARKLGVPMLTARARRLEDGLSFAVTFDPPVPPEAGEAEMMREVNARFSRWIEEAPGQWFWLHRRWRGRRRRREAGRR